MDKIFKPKFLKQKGTSVFMGILVMTVLLTISLGMTSALVVQIKTIRNVGYSVTAFYAAETGIETALNDPNCTTTCAGYTDVNLDLDDGSKAYYTLSATGPLPPDCLGSNFCVKSVGTYNGTRRAIQISR
jgi:hypothetical protein